MILNYRDIIILKYFYRNKQCYNYLELAENMGIHPLILNKIIISLCKYKYLVYDKNNILTITYKGNEILSKYEQNTTYEPKEKDINLCNITPVLDSIELLQNVPYNDIVLQKTINTSILSRMREESHLLLGKMLLFNIFINLMTVCILLFLFYS